MGRILIHSLNGVARVIIFPESYYEFRVIVFYNILLVANNFILSSRASSSLYTNFMVN